MRDLISERERENSKTRFFSEYLGRGDSRRDRKIAERIAEREFYRYVPLNDTYRPQTDSGLFVGTD